MSKVIEINEKEFDDVLKANKYVFVDFFASWCPPCKRLAPVLDELSEAMGDKMAFVKINVDENEKISKHFSIISIPTMIVFKESTPIEKAVGFIEYEKIEEMIERVMNR